MENETEVENCERFPPRLMRIAWAAILVVDAIAWLGIYMVWDSFVSGVI